ncbi:holin [Streptomyces sp. NPDC087659]|uniref:holin n=1 Tax=Streptomyces sp. NPDC087659 TaxID=3365801 RepID=UPI0037F438AC
MNKPIEKKVKVASAATYLVSLGALAILGGVSDNPLLLSPLPDWLEPFVIALVPTAATAVGGWAAPHTPRSDA